MRKRRLEQQLHLLIEAVDQLIPDGAIKHVENDGVTCYELWPMAEETNEESPELPANKRAEILRKAEELINGERAQIYGAPEVSFGRIADILNAQGYRHHVQLEGEPLGITKANKLDAVDAALILLGMKLSRTGGARQHMDNWIDMAGYSGLGAELATPEYQGEENDEPA